MSEAAPLRIVVLGLSLSSSWGNGHATTYRALLRALAARGHDILFLERDVPWYAAHRDLEGWRAGTLAFYADLDGLDRWRPAIRDADLVIIGSYVPDGIDLCRLVLREARGITAFYDIDTPVTVAALEAGACAYISRDQVPGFNLYLSFTGGPMLARLERQFAARAARTLYCSVDPERYVPSSAGHRWDLGYLGTYAADRQAALEELLIEPARRMPQRRFVVAGAQYPLSIEWPANVERIEHVPPDGHAAFYGDCRLALNITRADMRRAGWSPSVRLFEAAACGAAMISDDWPGLDSFFARGRDILIAGTARQIITAIETLGDDRLAGIGRGARRRVLGAHTAQHRAVELERHFAEATERRAERSLLPARTAAQPSLPALQLSPPRPRCSADHRPPRVATPRRSIDEQ